MLDELQDNSDTQPGLGLFARLPYDVRVEIWLLLQDDTALLTSRSLRDDILSTLRLTFEISGDPYSVSSTRETSLTVWPTEIRVYHQLSELAPLHPAFFDFRSPEPDRLDNFLKIPLCLYRSVTVQLETVNSYNINQKFARLYNSLSWLLDLLNQMNFQRLPPTCIVFRQAAGVRFQWLRDSKVFKAHIPNQPIWDRLHPANKYVYNEFTDFWICLRTLRKLRNVERLFIQYPAAFRQCLDWTYFKSLIREVKALCSSSTAFGDLEVDEFIQKEIDWRTVFFELSTDGLGSCPLLITERLAFWSETYEKAAHKRLDNLTQADGTVPAFVLRARRKLDGARLLGQVYKPHIPHPPSRSEELLREERGAHPDAGRLSEAWFAARCTGPRSCVPKYGSNRFKKDLSNYEERSVGACA